MSEKLSNGQMLTDNKTNYYAWIFTGTVLFSLVLWLFCIFYNGVDAVQFDIFYARCQEILSDCTNPCGYAAGRDVYRCTMHGPGTKAYPPLPYIFSYIISRTIIAPNQVYVFAYTQPHFLAMFIVITAFVIAVFHSIVLSNVIGTDSLKYLCSFAITFCGPMIHLIERGNYILFSLIFCIVYCFWYNSNSKLKREVALICLALAFATKISPCLFGILLLIDKRYKDAIRVALYGIILVFVPFLFFEGGFDNIPILIKNMRTFFTYIHLDVMSLKGIVYGLLGVNRFNIIATTIASTGSLTQQYVVLDALINLLKYIGIISFLITIPLHDTVWKKLLAISLVIIVMPQVSCFYTILYLLPSLMFFLNERNHQKTDIICLFAYILMCCVFFFSVSINYQLPVFILYIYMLFQSLNCIYDYIRYHCFAGEATTK